MVGIDPAGAFSRDSGQAVAALQLGLRPLSHEALEYARLDSHYLLALRALQLRELEARRRLEEAMQAFRRQENLEPTEKVFDPERFWRVRGVRDLSHREQGILRELYILRDSIACRLDLPPFKVMTDATLVRLAQIQPANQAELERVKGLSQRLKKRYGRKLIQAIQNGSSRLPPDPGATAARACPTQVSPATKRCVPGAGTWQRSGTSNRT